MGHLHVLKIRRAIEILQDAPTTNVLVFEYECRAPVATPARRSGAAGVVSTLDMHSGKNAFFENLCLPTERNRQYLVLGMLDADLLLGQMSLCYVLSDEGVVSFAILKSSSPPGRTEIPHSDFTTSILTQTSGADRSTEKVRPSSSPARPPSGTSAGVTAPMTSSRVRWEQRRRLTSTLKVSFSLTFFAATTGSVGRTRRSSAALTAWISSTDA